MPGIVGCVTRMPREARRSGSSANGQRLCFMRISMLEARGPMNRRAFTSAGLHERALSPMECPCEMNAETWFLRFPEKSFQSRALPQRLKAQGHEFDMDGPSYLVHLYEDDPSFPAGLNGRFHGLLADRNRGNFRAFQ